jgi:hypothetical protein
VLEHRPRAFALAAGDWYVVADDGYVICRVGEKDSRGDDGTAASAKTAAAGSDGSGSTAGQVVVADGASGAAASPAAAKSPAEEPGQASEAASPVASATAAGDSAAGTSAAGEAAGAAAGAGVAISGDGAVLSALEQGPAGSSLTLPRLAVSGRISPGSVIEDGSVTTALRILDGLPAKIRRQVAVVAAGRGGHLTLRLSDGPTVVWGDGARALAKTIALGVVLERYRRAGRAPTYIDVAVPDTVLAKPVLK